ncbi:hypothetical protein V5799_004874 [Amblyomma americanum]|uniref:Carboxylesterase type B domain-containing protein n=1 Tax=Amblyomma americanum TaxID=6943 RepID=A0AAQ4D4V2_AMBAM
MSEKLDVMVYFHGGVFVFERPLIQRDLRYMAALGNVVLVKMNYRLGAFGFLYGNHDGAPGNMGLYDQYLALLFVRDNIHLFGGDPEKITAFGNSAGAMSIGLMAVQTELFANIEVYLPVFGDAMLPVHILTALKRGLFNKDLKLLIGVTPDEGTSILNTASPQFFQRDSHRKVSKSDLLSTCNRTFLYTFSKAKLRRIYWNYMGLLGHTSYLTQRTALSNCIADYFMLCPAHHFAQELNRKGVETYFYLFDYRTKNSITPPWMGVVHTAEVYYLFGEPFSTNWYTDEEREFSKTIVDIWSTFARTGQPPKHLRWPKYLWSRPRYLRLNPRKFAPGRGPREQWCRLWNDPIK